MTGPIPILVYHRIDQERLSTSTAPYVFRRHLAWLSRCGWRSLSLDEFEFYASRAEKYPSRSFLLTFDDGYSTLESAALPILREFNFQAICFAATHWIGDDEGNDITGSEPSAYLSWRQVKNLQATGLVEFQSHSHRHWRLHDQSDADLLHDLRTSKEMLASKLALPRSHFRHLAWPWGDSTETSRRLALQSGFNFQYTVSREAFQHSSSLQVIPRTCYDGATYADFRIQFWLQTGPLSKPWHTGYPVARKLRRASAIEAKPNAVGVQGTSVEQGQG